MLTNQVEDEWCKLAQLGFNRLIGHCVDEDGYELEASRSDTTSVAIGEEGPHVVLLVASGVILPLDLALPAG